MTKQFFRWDSVTVNPRALESHEFSARVDEVYPPGHPSYGMIRVIDQDDDAWDVFPDELSLD